MFEKRGIITGAPCCAIVRLKRVVQTMTEPVLPIGY